MNDTVGRPRLRDGWRGAAISGLVPLVMGLSATPAASDTTSTPPLSTRPINRATATAAISVSVNPPLTVSTTLPLDSGTVVGGAKVPESIAIPASDFGNGGPQPTYTNLTPSTVRGAEPATAAQIRVTGAPNQSYSVTVTGWVLKSRTGTVSASTAPTGVSLYFATPKYTVPGTSAKGTLDNHGQATVGIGATLTLTLPRGASGEVAYSPTVTVAYN